MMPKSYRRHFRWSLRGLLLLFIPLCLVLAWQGHVHRQRRLADDAIQLMCGKGMDGNVGASNRFRTVSFKHGNVSDADLAAFADVFNGYAPAQWQSIETMHLHGSPVSADALQRFRHAVPQCKLEP